MEKAKIHYKKDVSGNFILDVSGNKIVDFEETIKIKTPLYLNYNNIFCYHIQATQELDKKVKSLENESQMLKNENQLLKEKIEAIEKRLAYLGF